MNDFLEQIGMIKKMGSLSDLIEKIPGRCRQPAGRRPNRRQRARAHHGHHRLDDRGRTPQPGQVHRHQLGRNRRGRQAQEEALGVFDQGRVQRVARGSGRREQEVGDLLNRFAMMRQMMGQMGKSSAACSARSPA